MKVYAVVCKETNNVIANFLDHGIGKVKINDIKLGIMDHHAPYEERTVIKVAEVFLSSSKKNIDKLQQLDVDAFIVESTDHEEVDFIYLSRDPERDIALCTPKE